MNIEHVHVKLIVQSIVNGEFSVVERKPLAS